MDTIKVQGIILKSIPYSETSKIVKIQTRDIGIISCLVRGAMRKTAKISKYLLQDLTIVDLVLKRSKSSELFYIQEIRPLHLYKTINSYPADMVKNCIFMFLNEFLNKCLKEGDTSQELFDFICNSLIMLDTEEKISPEYHIIFLTQMAEYIGFAFPEPTVEHYKYYDIHENRWQTDEPLHHLYINEEYTRYILEAKQLAPNERISNCCNGTIRRTVTEQLIKFYQYHIPEIGRIRSLEILAVVLG